MNDQPRNMMADPRATPAHRRHRILDAAAHAFAESGYRAASLRDIAREAACSLTLLDHHFGNKADLLDAVIKHQHENCQKRLAGLKALLAQPSGFVLEDFVAMWVTYEFDLHATREGRQYLTLMLRLQADREVDEEMRRSLNCSEASVVQGFTRAWPALDERARTGVWLMTSSALYAAVIRADEAADAARPDATALARRRTIAFLLDGLRGYCDCATEIAAATHGR